MKAVQALKILTGDSTTAHISVVALSANVIPADFEKCMEAEFFRYLTKPIKINEFMDTLDLTLQFANTKAHSATQAEFI